MTVVSSEAVSWEVAGVGFDTISSEMARIVLVAVAVGLEHVGLEHVGLEVVDLAWRI